MRRPVTPKPIPLGPLIGGAVAVLAGIVLLVWLSRPHAQAPSAAVSMEEAKAYLPNLALGDVSMEATENFMKQQVVEVQGKITNNGPKALRAVNVYCLFYGVDGGEIHRELVPIVQATTAPVRSGESRGFRLPFDALPDGWNQAMPKLVIASIEFAS